MTIHFVFAPELEQQVRDNYSCAKDNEVVGTCRSATLDGADVLVFGSGRITISEATDLANAVQGVQVFDEALPENLVEPEPEGV